MLCLEAHKKIAESISDRFDHLERRLDQLEAEF